MLRDTKKSNDHSKDSQQKKLDKQQPKQVVTSNHLMLYVDINGTILAGDSANAKSLTTAVNQMLCENFKADWVSVLTPAKLSAFLKAHFYSESKNEAQVDREILEWQSKFEKAKIKKEAVTFREFIEAYLHPGDDKDKVLKKLRQKWYDLFTPYLAAIGHPEHDAVKLKYGEILAKLKKDKLFTSFINTIKSLDASKRPYTVILSTFGDDLKMVTDEIQQRTGLACEYLARYKEHVMHAAEFKNDALHLDEKTAISSPQNIRDQFKKFKLCGVKYDWGHWNSHEEKRAFAKLFIHDHNSLFFDDNALEKEIIYPFPITPMAGVTPDILHERLVLSGHVVAVNTMLACCDDDFFLTHIRKFDERAQAGIVVPQVPMDAPMLLFGQQPFLPGTPVAAAGKAPLVTPM